MARTDLTDARIGGLRPRNSAYDIRDGKLRDFGLRVLPSGGKRFFLHCQQRGERVWKIVGDAATMDVREARSRAAHTRKIKKLFGSSLHSGARVLGEPSATRSPFRLLPGRAPHFSRNFL